MIITTVDDEEVQEVLDTLIEKSEDLSDPLSDIGQISVESVHSRIDAEGYGEWDPLLTPSDHPMLKDSGAMYEAVGYQAHGQRVDIEDGVSYAAYQDSMRPFMFLDDAATTEIEDIIVQHFEVDA
jgi:phage gpG-like protein